MQMPREDSRARAIRFLTEARVCILRVSTDDVLGVVRGDSGSMRTVQWSRDGGWRCDCPALGPCAHGRAVAAVVVVEQVPGRWIDLGAEVSA